MEPISGGLAYDFKEICRKIGIRDFEDEETIHPRSTT